MAKKKKEKNSDVSEIFFKKNDFYKFIDSQKNILELLIIFAAILAYSLTMKLNQAIKLLGESLMLISLFSMILLSVAFIHYSNQIKTRNFYVIFLQLFMNLFVFNFIANIFLLKFGFDPWSINETISWIVVILVVLLTLILNKNLMNLLKESYDAAKFLLKKFVFNKK